MSNSSLPNTLKNSPITSRFYNRYSRQEIPYNASEVDAVIAYFLKRGFDQVAAANTAAILLQQASIEKISPFKLIETLKGLSDVQLSNVVAQLLNLSREKCSSVGYRIPSTEQLFDQRNIIV